MKNCLLKLVEPEDTIRFGYKFGLLLENLSLSSVIRNFFIIGAGVSLNPQARIQSISVLESSLGMKLVWISSILIYH